MNDDIKQQLSALIDGELDAQQARFLLRRLEHDPDLLGCWQRWHLARACLRPGLSALPDADFGERIRIALADAPVPRRGVAATVLRWTGGAAVAASVAVAALLALPTSTPLPSSAPVPVATAPTASPQVAASQLTERDLRPQLGQVAQTVAASADARALAPALRVDPRLESYLVRHSALQAQNGGDSFLPFVYVVTPARPWSMLPPATLAARDGEPSPR